MFKRKWVFLLVLFSVSLFLRLVYLDRYPPGFTPDEAAQGYSAYSLLRTGQDEWGERLPLTLRSFGDFKPPLQTYLIVPSVAFLGLTKTAVRLPNALLAALAPVAVFFLVQELFGIFPLSVVAGFLLALSPWHIMLSRGAFEANLTVFFITWGSWFFLKGLKTNQIKWLGWGGLFFGLNLFSYHSAKVVTPATIALILFFFVFQKKDKTKEFILIIRKNLFFFIVFAVFFLIAFSSFFAGGQKRGVDIAVFNPTDGWQAVKDARWWSAKTLPDQVGRVFHNKVSFSLAAFSKNYLAYLSPQFLFSQGAGEGTYGMIPGRGVLWWWELPVILFGLYRLTNKPDKRVWLVLALVLLAPIPAALTKGTRAANRAAVMMPWIQIFTAWSLVQFFSLKSVRRLGRKGGLLFAGMVLFFLAFFLEDYFVQSRRKIARPMLFGRCQALNQAEKIGGKQIIVSRKLSEPQAYVMFCRQYPSGSAQGETSGWLRYEKEGLSFLDQLGEYRLGKYRFRELNWASDSQLEDAVLVGLPKEFPQEFRNEAVLYPDGSKAIIVYETKNKSEKKK